MEDRESSLRLAYSDELLGALEDILWLDVRRGRHGGPGRDVSSKDCQKWYSRCRLKK